MTTKDDTIPTVTLAGATYRLTESVRFSTLLDLTDLAGEGRAGYLRACAIALYERCPVLRSRLGLGPYSGNPRDFAGRVLDALVDPAHRGGKARESTAVATTDEVYRALGAAGADIWTPLNGTAEDEVEAVAGNSDATP